GLEAVLLAPLFQPSTGLELRQSPGPRRDVGCNALLAEHGGRWFPAGRGPVSGGARRNQLRKSRRNTRRDQGTASTSRPRIPRPETHCASHQGAPHPPHLLRQGRGIPNAVQFPPKAADVHGRKPGGPKTDPRNFEATPEHSKKMQMVLFFGYHDELTLE